MELNFRSNPNVWGYFSVSASGGVHEYADSQFGHIFSYGETRDTARKNLVMALKDLSIRGDFRTTVEYLTVLLEADVYKDNQINTSWLDKLIADRNTAFEESDAVRTATIGGIARMFQMFTKNINDYRICLQKGQSPSEALLHTKSTFLFIINGLKFKIEVGMTGPESVFVKMGDSTIYANVRTLPDSGMLIQLDGNSHVSYIKDDPLGTLLEVDGKTCTLEKENDPTLIRSPSPGKLVRYLVESGDHVNGGDAIAEIEVMKMFMSIFSADSGVITTTKPSGSTLACGDVIASLVLDDPARVKLATFFNGSLPNYSYLDDNLF